MGASPGANKARKKRLAKSGAIHCGYCPYHKWENRKGKIARPDFYKSKRKGRV